VKENNKTEKHRRAGTLFVISAPSGAGKSTLCRELLRKVRGIKLSVSYTTRKPRKGEINNIHYTFISQKRFKNMINRGEFAEWAMVHGNLYGTSIKRLKKLNGEGYDIILDIDVQGAQQVKGKYKNAVYIFILPPSMKILKQRLMDRKTESEDAMTLRLKKAKDEISGYKEYDYVIINDKIARAYRDLESIIISTRLKTENMDHKRKINIIE
jgi:guanylate kinase